MRTQIAASITTAVALLVPQVGDTSPANPANPAVSTAGPAGTRQCTVLTQSQNRLGTYRCVLAEDAIRIEVVGSNAYLISKAPTWRVVFFNPTNKKAMDSNLKEYLVHVPRWHALDGYFGYGDDVKGKPRPRPADFSQYARAFEVAGKISYASLDCVKYGKVEVQNGRVDPKNRYSRLIYMWSSQSAKGKPGVILCHFEHLETGLSGVPLYFNDPRPDQKAKESDAAALSSLMKMTDMSQKLTTSKTEQHAYPASYFEYPKAFSKVQSEIDVLSDSQSRSAAADMLNGMKVGQ